MKYIWILILFIGLPVYANDDCTPVNLEKPGGSLENVRPHTQGDLNICTYNAISQMVDAFRHTEKGEADNHITSPLALAVHRHSIPVKSNTRPKPKQFFFEFSGTTCHTFNALKEHGYGSCNESSVVKQLASASEDQSSALMKALGLASASGQLNVGLDKIDEYTEAMDDCELHPETRVGDNIFLSAAELKVAIERMGGNKALKKNVNEACSGDNKLPLNMTCESELETIGGKFWEQQSYALDVIHNHLTKKNAQPIGLTMCMESLVKKGHTMSISRNSKGQYVQSNCGVHTLLVAGRRRAPNGECQFLIRNSTEIPCRDHVQPQNCSENGRVYWMSESDLDGNIVDITRFKKE